MEQDPNRKRRQRVWWNPTRNKKMITSHVLDLSQGGPAVGMTVILEIRQGSEWAPVGRAATDEKGRVATLTEGLKVVPGTYRLTFDLANYHAEHGVEVSLITESQIECKVLASV